MITRFRPKWDEDAVVMESCGDGDYVRHIDHAERIAALETQVAEVEEYLPPESPAYQSMGERAKLLKDQMQYATESSGELGRALAALEAQAATAIAMRDLEERNKIDFIQQLERSESQVRQLRDALKNALAVFDSMDVYRRYVPVRDQMRAALAATEPPAPACSIESTYRERE